MRSFGRILWKSGLFFLIWALLIALLIVPIGPRLEEWEKTSPLRSRLVADAAGAVSMLAATWLMTRFVDRRRFHTVGFGRPHLLRDLAVGLAAGAVWLGTSVGIAWGAGWVTPRPAAAVTWSVLSGAAVALFLNVLTQQLLLCGYLFRTIRAGAGGAAAVGVSAALFAVYHAGAFHGAWLPALNVFGAGLLFCLARSLTDGLWLPLSIHFAWNFLLGPVLGLTVSGSEHLGSGWQLLLIEGPAVFTGGAFGLEGGLVVTLTTLAGVTALLLLGWRRAGKGEAPAPAAEEP